MYFTKNILKMEIFFFCSNLAGSLEQLHNEAVKCICTELYCTALLYTQYRQSTRKGAKIILPCQHTVALLSTANLCSYHLYFNSRMWKSLGESYWNIFILSSDLLMRTHAWYWNNCSPTFIDHPLSEQQLQPPQNISVLSFSYFVTLTPPRRIFYKI